jgi:hypothetical protein
METIISYVQKRLRETPRSEWEALALRLVGNKSASRKLAYERTDAWISNVEPFYRHFLKVDTGAKLLPHERI